MAPAGDALTNRTGYCTRLHLSSHFTVGRNWNVPVVFGCLQMQRTCVTSLSPKINIRPSLLSAPHIPCKINKEIRPSSNVCHGHVQRSKPAHSCLQFVVWASASAALRHATVLQTSSAAVQLSEDSQCTWQSLCEYFVHMYMAHLASSLRVCVYACVSRWDTATRQQWCAVSCCCLNQTLLDPLSYLAPVWENIRQEKRRSLRENVRKSSAEVLIVRCLCTCTCWMCVSGLAVAQISQPGRDGLLMKVHEGQAHSVCWEIVSSHSFKEETFLPNHVNMYLPSLAVWSRSSFSSVGVEKYLQNRNKTIVGVSKKICTGFYSRITSLYILYKWMRWKTWR